MNLSFFTKIFGRSVQLSSSIGKTFSYLRDSCLFKDKVYQADIYRKYKTGTSCPFNGFKYILPGPIVQMVVSLIANPDVKSLTPPGSILLWRLIIKYFLLSLASFYRFKKEGCPLLVVSESM